MGTQVYQFIMQELVKYRGMYTSMAELLKSGTPGPDLHAHHDLLASALPQGSGGQVLHFVQPQDSCCCLYIAQDPMQSMNEVTRPRWCASAQLC